MVRRVLLAALALIVALPTGFILIEHWRGKRQLARTLSRLDDTRFLPRFADLFPPAVPASSNGFTAFQQASEALGQDPETRWHWPGPRMILSGRVVPSAMFTNWESTQGNPTTWDTAAAWAADHGDALDSLRASLLAFPHRRPPPLESSPGPETHLPRLSLAKSAAIALGLESTYAAHSGNLDAALTNLHAMRRLELDLSDQPILIEHLVRLACAAIARDRAWDIFWSSDWTEPQLHLLQAALPSPSVRDGLLLAFRGELALVRLRLEQGSPDAFVKDLMGESSPPSIGPFNFSLPTDLDDARRMIRDLADRISDGFEAGVFRSFWAFAWRDQAIVHYLISLEEIMATAAQSVHAASARDLETFDLEERLASDARLDRFRHVISRNALPPFMSTMRKAFRYETERALLETAIALRRFELRQGRLPDQLGDLVPEFLATVPLDGMDGAPLRYRLTTDGGFALWSVGENGVDDGGDSAFSEKHATLFLWHGRDAVWPRPATDAEFATWRRKERARREQTASTYRMSPDLMRRYGLLPAAPSTNAAPRP